MRQKTIMCYGDSNTWGYEPGTGQRYGRDVRWPGVLQRVLGQEYYVIEEGLCGRTTVWDDPVEGYKNGLSHLVPLLHSHAPLDLIIIMLGTNDLKCRFSVSAMDIALSVGRLVKTVRTSEMSFTGPPPEVLVVCPPAVHELEGMPFGAILEGGYEKSRQLYAAFTQVCEDIGVEMLCAGEYVEVSTVDAVHLTAEDHVSLGTAVASRVQSMLS